MHSHPPEHPVSENMSAAIFPAHQYSGDGTIIPLADKIALPVGTAQIFRQYTDLVKRVIEPERPDSVCIELDNKRYAPLLRKCNLKNLLLDK